MAVISVKVPDEVKREMDRLRKEVRWSEEIREFLRQRIEKEKRREAVGRAEEILRPLPTRPGGLASRMVRESRDGH
jgi:metal-responsive CopG/Arc/MetJ family transcriptional regulator